MRTLTRLDCIKRLSLRLLLPIADIDGGRGQWAIVDDVLLLLALLVKLPLSRSAAAWVGGGYGGGPVVRELRGGGFGGGHDEATVAVLGGTGGVIALVGGGEVAIGLALGAPVFAGGGGGRREPGGAHGFPALGLEAFGLIIAVVAVRGG